MSKKGQGISLQMIIVAALGLTVLVVVWLIFTGRLGLFTRGLEAQDDLTQSIVDDIYSGKFGVPKEEAAKNPKPSQPSGTETGVRQLPQGP